VHEDGKIKIHLGEIIAYC